MLLVARRKRRLSWIIKIVKFRCKALEVNRAPTIPALREVAHDKEIFRLSKHSEAELFARVSSLVSGRARQSVKSTSSKAPTGRDY
jgi:hypothetical protein